MAVHLRVRRVELHLVLWLLKRKLVCPLRKGLSKGQSHLSRDEQEKTKNSDLSLDRRLT